MVSAGESRLAGFGLWGASGGLLACGDLGQGGHGSLVRESGGWQCDSALVGMHMAVCSGPARGLQGANTVAVRSALWLMDAKH